MDIILNSSTSFSEWFEKIIIVGLKNYGLCGKALREGEHPNFILPNDPVQDDDDVNLYKTNLRKFEKECTNIKSKKDDYESDKMKFVGLILTNVSGESLRKAEMIGQYKNAIEINDFIELVKMLRLAHHNQISGSTGYIVECESEFSRFVQGELNLYNYTKKYKEMLSKMKDTGIIISEIDQVRTYITRLTTDYHHFLTEIYRYPDLLPKTLDDAIEAVTKFKDSTDLALRTLQTNNQSLHDQRQAVYYTKADESINKNQNNGTNNNYKNNNNNNKRTRTTSLERLPTEEWNKLSRKEKYERRKLNQRRIIPHCKLCSQNGLKDDDVQHHVGSIKCTLFDNFLLKNKSSSNKSLNVVNVTTTENNDLFDGRN